MKKGKKQDAVFREAGSGVQRFNALRPGTNAAFSGIFILLALLCVIPVVFVIIISFSSQASIGKAGYTFVPAEWSAEAYRYVWHLRDYHGFPTVLRSLINSLGITLAGTALGLMLITTMGYVISRKTFRLRKAFAVFIFIPMIFNGGLLATYVVNAQLLHLKNTYFAVILPLACSSFYIMVTSTFFRMAIVVITVVPIMFSYPCFQKYFVTGLTVGSVKE